MPPPMNRTRKITIAPEHRFDTYVEWQSNYMDQMTGWLIPNTEIWVGNELRLQVNSLGCKGPELRPEAPVIGFFGDSTTMGLANESWVRHVDIPGCQTLNAGIEGHNLDRVVARYQQLSSRVDFVGVVVYAGWHNIIYNKREEANWRQMFDHFDQPGMVAFCTLATCLTEECRVKGITPHLNNEACGTEFDPGTTDDRVPSGVKPYFNFWCSMERSQENVNKVLDGIDRYNSFLRSYCEEKGRVLIDLYSHSIPASYDSIPRDFFDVCHYRSHAYPRVGAFVRDAITEPMKPALAAWQTSTRSSLRTQRPSPVLMTENVPRPASDKRRGRFYPIW